MVMVRSTFAKITDAKWFLCFFMVENTPAERKSPWDNHKSFRSSSSSSTSCSSSNSSNTSSAAETFVVIPGTFPFSWSVFYHQKTYKSLGISDFRENGSNHHPSAYGLVVFIATWFKFLKTALQETIFIYNLSLSKGNIICCCWLLYVTALRQILIL